MQIPNMAYRVITPSTFHIESDLQQAMNEQTVEKGTREENDHKGFYDEIEQSPRNRLENSGKKKRRRRRSGREVSICEEKMNEAEEEDVRKELTYIEEDEDLMKGRAAQPNVGLCMDSSEGKSNDKLSTKVVVVFDCFILLAYAPTYVRYDSCNADKMQLKASF